MRINIDDTEFGYDLAYYYQDELFTGEIVETDRNGNVVGLKTLIDGRGHGPERIWFPSGQLKLEMMHKEGNPIGVSRSWYASGQIAEERVFDDRGFVIDSRRWHEDGSVAPVQHRAIDRESGAGPT